MRSSRCVDRVSVRVAPFLGIAGLLVVACSAPPVGQQTAAQSTVVECAADPGNSPQDAEAGASLRRTVETGPLYMAIASTADVASCRIGNESGALTLVYTFRDGGSLRVNRDARIEYTSQEVRFASPYAESPVAVLTRAEQAAFGGGGCGIDWRQAETSPAADDAGATDTIYRGNVCNCQARVRTDAAGRTVGLVFRSAC